MASPEEILQVLANTSIISNDLQQQAVPLSAALRSQLQEVARVNGGKVPLHGRLFAQWLHYLLPQECPFPHKTGEIAVLSPSKFGDQSFASAEEMTNHKSMTAMIQNVSSNWDEQEEWLSQWKETEEELLSNSFHMQAPWERASQRSGVLIAFCLALVLVGIRYRFWLSPKEQGIPIALRTRTHCC